MGPDIFNDERMYISLMNTQKVVGKIEYQVFQNAKELIKYMLVQLFWKLLT